MAKKTNKKDESSEIPSAPAVFDVSKPGETAADPTSRPIIVGHTSTLKQYPMVAPAQDESGQTEEKTLTKKSENIVSPVNEEPKETLEDEKNDDDSQKDNKEESTVQQNTEEGAQSDKPSTSESSEIEAVAGEAETKKLGKHDLEEQKKEQEKLEELVSSKKYFLPIREGGKKRSGEIILFWILLILILVFASAWFIVDAGYYDPGFELPYDLF